MAFGLMPRVFDRQDSSLMKKAIKDTECGVRLSFFLSNASVRLASYASLYAAEAAGRANCAYEYLTPPPREVCHLRAGHRQSELAIFEVQAR